ncbi:F-box protein SKIP24 [Medicago truncatula]|uniref:F-box protein SKIP24 n=1 Tax=Medicago truncatula TaxID=3880 RepID=G7L2N5_MEDTR|nr:F-box protein SKIP24 [Medicago truncatula]
MGSPGEASVALNVWQPEVVRGRQKQMVEQCGMEHRLCTQRVLGLEKSYMKSVGLDNAKEELESLKSHPLQNHKPVGGGENEHKVKQKKLKSCNDCESDDNFSI